jgi:hypothetical protein
MANSVSGNSIASKSFQSLAISEALLSKTVEAIKAGEKEARSTGVPQSFEAMYRGFRQNIAIGKIVVVPPAVADKKGQDFPTALLYGCLVRTFGGEEMGDLISHKIGDSEWDEYSQASYSSIKEELFGTEDGKFACLVLFIPNWVNKREYVGFQFPKDDNQLTNLTRHLVFSSYFDPRLSSAFDAMMTDVETSKFDVTDITPKLNFPALAENPLKEYPLLTKEGSQKKPRLGLTIKTADEVTKAVLEPQEMDVFESLDTALRNSLLPSDSKGVEDASEGKAPTKGEMVPRLSSKEAEYQPKTGQPCTCRPGVQRDNCPQCEGTGQRIDFAAIRKQNGPKSGSTKVAHGYIAFYGNKRVEVQADTLWGAKQKAIEMLKVPKSKQGLLAIELAEKDGEQVTTTITSSATAVFETPITNVGPGTEAHDEANQRTEGYKDEKDTPKAVINSAPIGIALDETGVPRRAEEERKEKSAARNFYKPPTDPQAENVKVVENHKYTQFNEKPDGTSYWKSPIGTTAVLYPNGSWMHTGGKGDGPNALSELLISYHHERVPKVGKTAAYGDRRDYPKIDLFVNGEYVASTTWASNIKEAIQKYEEKNPGPWAGEVKAQYDKRASDKQAKRVEGLTSTGDVERLAAQTQEDDLSASASAAWDAARKGGKEAKEGLEKHADKMKEYASSLSQDNQAHHAVADHKKEIAAGKYGPTPLSISSSEKDKATDPQAVRDHIKKNVSQARQGQDALKDHHASFDAEKWGGLGKKQASALWVGSAKKIAAEFDEFTHGYIETALWSSNDESDPSGGQPLDANYDIRDLSPSCLQAMTEDCAKFQAENAELLAAASEQDGQDGFRQGHDFWLTRCGHGAGYWDGDYPTTGDGLTEASEAWGNVDIYVGDDDMIYQYGSETGVSEKFPSHQGPMASSKKASKKTASQNDASYIASLIGGGFGGEDYDARSQHSKTAAQKREDEMARKYSSQRKKFADVPQDIDDIWSETMEDMGPAPEIRLPGESMDNEKSTTGEHEIEAPEMSADSRSDVPEQVKGDQEEPTVKVEEALENDTTKSEEDEPSTGDDGASADSKEPKSEGGKSEWSKNRSKGKSEKKDEPKEEKESKEASKMAAANSRPRQRVHCDRCEMLSINGTATHERGCPNQNSRWDSTRQDWVKQRRCAECGMDVDADDPCCSAEPSFDEDEGRFAGLDTILADGNETALDQMEEAQATAPAVFYECGACGGVHPSLETSEKLGLGWNGDCRDENGHFEESDVPFGDNTQLISLDEQMAPDFDDTILASGESKTADGEQFCTECGRPISLDMDSEGVSHHLTDLGEIDFNADADHVALAEQFDGGLEQFMEPGHEESENPLAELDQLMEPQHKRRRSSEEKTADYAEDDFASYFGEAGKIQANYAEGDEFRLSEDALENYGEEYRDGVFTVDAVYDHYVPSSSMGNDRTGSPGFDESAGTALYGSELNFDVYEWEMEPANAGHEASIKQADTADNPANEADGEGAIEVKTAGRSSTPKYVIRIPGSTDAAWNVTGYGQQRGAGQPNQANLARYMEALLKSMEPGGHNEHLVGHFDPTEAAIYPNNGTYKDPLATWSKEDEIYPSDADNDKALKEIESSDVSGDFSEANSEVESPDTVDTDIKQPTESVGEAGKHAADISGDISEAKSEVDYNKADVADEAQATDTVNPDHFAAEQEYWDKEAADGYEVPSQYRKDSAEDDAEPADEEPDEQPAEVEDSDEGPADEDKPAAKPAETEDEPAVKKQTDESKGKNKPAETPAADAKAPAAAPAAPAAAPAAPAAVAPAAVAAPAGAGGNGTSETSGNETSTETGGSSPGGASTGGVGSGMGGAVVAELGTDALNAHQADDKTACAGYGDEEDEERRIDSGLGDLGDLVVEKEID